MIYVPGWTLLSTLIGCLEDAYSRIALASDRLMLASAFAYAAEILREILHVLGEKYKKLIY